MTSDLKIIRILCHGLAICLGVVLSGAAMARAGGLIDQRASTGPSDQADTNSSTTEVDARKIAIIGQETPLRVPVYPRSNSEDKPLPKGADLRDQYIVLDDGSVLSMADWILGALKKNDIYSEMSDAERRIFLGEVARSMAQEGRLLGAKPGVPLPAPAPPEELISDQPVDYLGVRLPNLLQPGPPKRSLIGNGFDLEQNVTDFIGFNDPIGTSDPVVLNGGRINLLKTEYERIFEHHVQEWQYRGTQLNMLNDFKAKLKREGRSE